MSLLVTINGKTVSVISFLI